MNSTRQTLIINYYTLVEIAQAPVQWIERIENLLFPIIYWFFSLTNKKYFLRKKKKFSMRRVMIFNYFIINRKDKRIWWNEISSISLREE